jgi:hypothetical protein
MNHRKNGLDEHPGTGARFWPDLSGWSIHMFCAGGADLREHGSGTDEARGDPFLASVTELKDLIRAFFGDV